MDSYPSALEGDGMEGKGWKLSKSPRKPDPLAIRQEEGSGKCCGEEGEWKQDSLVRVAGASLPNLPPLPDTIMESL